MTEASTSCTSPERRAMTSPLRVSVKKPIGSDSENGKSTYVSLLGLERSGELAAELTDKAKSVLDIFGDEGEFLAELADKLSSRKS